MASEDKGHTLHRGRLITLCREPVALPGGRCIELDIVHHPGGAVVVPLRDDGQVCLLRQYRHAAGGDIWEVPAGCIDAGDHSPLLTRFRLVVRNSLHRSATLTPSGGSTGGGVRPSDRYGQPRFSLSKASEADASMSLTGTISFPRLWHPLPKK